MSVVDVSSRNKQEWYLGAQQRGTIPGAEGFIMLFGQSFQPTVVFIGYRDSSVPSGFLCAGTGFLVAHKGSGYLVTARHVAAGLQDGPFVIRVNKKEGASFLDGDSVRWYTLDDPTVDVAAIPLWLSRKDGYDTGYIPTDLFVTKKVLKTYPINLGSVCYTLGLFHFIHGRNRNLPLLYTGNIAAFPPEGETVPVWDPITKSIQQVEAYLVESGAIDGASGSPVFTRCEIMQENLKLEDGHTVNVALPEARVMLLGLFASAWFMPPDEALRGSIQARIIDKVPVGIGVVIPADKILEVLELPELQEIRDRREAARAAETTKVGVKQEPPTKADNPDHREDFNRLLDAAVPGNKSDH